MIMESAVVDQWKTSVGASVSSVSQVTEAVNSAIEGPGTEPAATHKIDYVSLPVKFLHDSS